MNLQSFNRLDPLQAFDELMRCCGATRWAESMLLGRPYSDLDGLFLEAERVWASLGRDDYLEAFSHHPKIGDRDSLRAKFASTAQWAEGEQAGTATATEDVLDGLAEGNRRYEERFGYIFIVCATGKSAREMLDLLLARIDNDPSDELAIAAAEQAKITRLRLEKLLA